MSIEIHVGRVVGLAASLGVGAAIFACGSAQAAAEETDRSASPSASSSTSDSSRTPNNQPDNESQDSTDVRSSDREAAPTEPDSSEDDAVDVQSRSSATTPTEEDNSNPGLRSSEQDSESRGFDVDEPEEGQGRPATGRGTSNSQERPGDQPDRGRAAGRASAAALSATNFAAAESGSLRLAAPVNTAPTATTSVAPANPLTGVTAITVTGHDPDSDALTYTASNPWLGRALGDGLGNYTYTPTGFGRLLARFLPFLRSDRFIVTVADGRGGTAAVTVNTTVVPLNSAPRVKSVTVNAAAPATGAVTGRAAAGDPDWDRITYTAATVVTAKGTATVNADGSFSYVPTAAARHAAASRTATDGQRTDSFTVTVTDVFGAATAIAVRVGILSANNAPTVVLGAHITDHTTGTVTGLVIGADIDDDELSYSGSTTTGKGAVIVAADGTFTYTPNEPARQAALLYDTPAWRSDEFAVSIDDGHGGTLTVPVSVTIVPSSATGPADLPRSTFCGCFLMPTDSIFHADIRDLPVLGASAEWIDLLGGGRGGTLLARWGGGEWMGSTGGIPVNVVAADHPKEVVIFNRGYSTTGPGIDDRPYAIPDRPLVEGMPSYPAWDRHLLVFQEGTCISQELINVANGVELPGAGIADILGNAIYRSLYGSTWLAQGGAQYDMNSARYPVIGHATASYLPLVPMMLRPDEIENGYVDHMLGLVIAKEFGAGYVWPALHGDGSGTDGVPMGMVFRLRGDIDISGFAASTQAVLRALQIHGGVVYDSTGPTDGILLSGMSNGWEGTDYRTMQRELNTIPLGWFEAVDVTGIAADPGVGWYIR